MTHLRPAQKKQRAVPYVEHFGNENDIVARLGMQAPNAEAPPHRDRRPALRAAGRVGSSAQRALSLSDWPRCSGTGGGAGGKARRRRLWRWAMGGKSATTPRLYGYINGGRRPTEGSGTFEEVARKIPTLRRVARLEPGRLLCAPAPLRRRSGWRWPARWQLLATLELVRRRPWWQPGQAQRRPRCTAVAAATRLLLRGREGSRRLEFGDGGARRAQQPDGGIDAVGPGRRGERGVVGGGVGDQRVHASGQCRHSG